MEESKKKLIMIGIIVVCLAAAAIIFVKNMSRDGRGRTSASETMWVKCSNPDCEAEYEMNIREYHKRVQIDADSMEALPMRCEKCGKDSAYLAE